MIVGFIVIIFCVGASCWRLRWAFAPTRLHIESLVEHIEAHGSPPDIELLAQKLSKLPDADSWEHGLADALSKSGDARAALLGEQQLELDAYLDRWGRVPRVCASIAASTGFLTATLTLREALAAAALELGSAYQFDEAVSRAITGVALGICGGVFCISVQRVARRGVSRNRASLEKLMDLEA